MPGKRHMQGTIEAMRKSAIILLIAAAIGLGNGADVRAANTPAKPMPEATPEMTERGHVTYIKRCSFCHGLLGDGEGPAAPYLDPRPRDFTLGTFKFRTTTSGQLPTDNDIFRTVSRGLPGTAMQAFDSDLFKNGLSEDRRWEVIAYIKTFAQEFDDPELDPVKTGMVLALPANRAPYSPETVAKGKEVFKKAKCWSCHGMSARGDGNKEFRKDDWGFPIRIRNVTHPWKIKGGSEVEQIYMRFTSGINGTPMPSFVKTLSEDDRWNLANYIKSLQLELGDSQVLKVMRVEGDLTDDPNAEVWKTAPPMDVRLTGQVVAAPRWQNPSIELVTMKAIYNDKDIAFQIVWDDPFKDVKHDKTKEMDVTEIRKVGTFSSYVETNDMIPRALETFRDSVALQFPVKPTEGTKKPHFLRGGTADAVHLMVWKSDTDSVEEAVARGWKQNPKAQADDKQNVASKAVWDEGQWRLVMKRPLITDDKKDVQFVEGKFIPMALNAWDGSNGEHGMIMSISTWYSVFIEAPVPMTVYLYSVLAVLIVGGIGFRLARKQEQSAADSSS